MPSEPSSPRMAIPPRQLSLSVPPVNEGFTPERLPRLTPDQYARAVIEFSRLPTGVGQNHERLAEFLEIPPYQLDIPPNPDSSIDDAFVTLYRLGSNKPGCGKSPNHPHEHSRGISFRNCAEFASVESPGPNDWQSHMLFMRGYPSAQWLRLIGSKYHVDPEFFARHMDFRSSLDKSNSFSRPSLPSSSWHLITMPVITIGFRDVGMRQYEQDEIDRMRRSAEKSMNAYHHQLSTGAGLKTGNAIVRQFSVLDERHFVIEQQISICVQQSGTSWIILVWLDSGNDLYDSIPGPWSERPDLTRFLPVMNYKPMDGLKSHLMVSKIPSDPRHKYVRRQPQSAALLHIEYGRSLRPNLMACDALYALSELFSMSAFSERQFLDVVESKLNRYHEKDDIADIDSLTNFKYIKRMLHRHKQQVQQDIDSIRDTDNRKWPKAAGELTEKAAITKEELLRDFHRNLDQAQILLTRCNEDTTMLMSSASIAESKKAIMLQERIGKLTFLAFIFVPLSFTTSFFSMSFKELGSNTNMSIWAWFLLSGLTVTISLLLVLFDLFAVWSSFICLCRRLICR